MEMQITFSTGAAQSAPLLPKTRKSNGKSKMGCSACRKRRIKCDELRPNCTKCRTQPHPCIYPPSKTVPRWKSNLSSFALSKSRNTAKERDAELGPYSNIESIWAYHAASPVRITLRNNREGGLEEEKYHFDNISLMPEEVRRKFKTQDVVLLVNFASRTIYDLVGPPSLWGEVLQLAFSHTFLLHAILTLSARHIQKVPGVASTHDYNYTLLEAKHLQVALTTYRPMVKSDTQSPEAIIATSFILYFHMCSVLDFDPFTKTPREDTSFKYLRGICSIITQGPGVKFKIALFRSLVPKPKYFPYFLPESSPVQGPGKVLITMLSGLDPLSDADRAIYLSRITSLAPYLVMCTQPDLVRGAVEELLIGFKRWQAHCPMLFDGLVKRFQPPALVVLGYYYAAIGMTLARMEGMWWWREKPEFIVKTIARYLGKEWEVYMQWPVEMASIFKEKMVLKSPAMGVPSGEVREEMQEGVEAMRKLLNLKHGGECELACCV